MRTKGKGWTPKLPWQVGNPREGLVLSMPPTPSSFTSLVSGSNIFSRNSLHSSLKRLTIQATMKALCPFFSRSLLVSLELSLQLLDPHQGLADSMRGSSPPPPPRSNWWGALGTGQGLLLLLLVFPCCMWLHLFTHLLYNVLHLRQWTAELVSWTCLSFSGGQIFSVLLLWEGRVAR